MGSVYYLSYLFGHNVYTEKQTYIQCVLYRRYLLYNNRILGLWLMSTHWVLTPPTPNRLSHRASTLPSCRPYKECSDCRPVIASTSTYISLPGHNTPDFLRDSKSQQHIFQLLWSFFTQLSIIFCYLNEFNDLHRSILSVESTQVLK